MKGLKGYILETPSGNLYIVVKIKVPILKLLEFINESNLIKDLKSYIHNYSGEKEDFYVGYYLLEKGYLKRKFSKSLNYDKLIIYSEKFWENAGKFKLHQEVELNQRILHKFKKNVDKYISNLMYTFYGTEEYQDILAILVFKNYLLNYGR